MTQTPDVVTRNAMHHMNVLQSRLAKCTADRDAALAKIVAAVERIDAAVERIEGAERAVRDVARDRDRWRAKAIRATELLRPLAVHCCDDNALAFLDAPGGA